MKIGYAKIGRSWKLDPNNGTATGGDADVVRALRLLAAARPDDQFILVGQNTGEDPASMGFPGNVINPWTTLRADISKIKKGGKLSTPNMITALVEATAPWFEDLDQMIVWAGQHGTSNTPIPMVEDRSKITTPQDSFVNYSSYLLHGINAWRDLDPYQREEVWLCPDPRNYLKCRDLKWPLKKPIIGQYAQTLKTKHERYGDTTKPTVWSADTEWDPKSSQSVWTAKTGYVYGALELTALPHPATVELHADHAGRQDFGMVVNENRAYVAKDRKSIMNEWVLSRWPQAEIFGKWSDESLADMVRPDIRPVSYDRLGSTLTRWRTTLTTPASGSGWATAKPWECFAYGVVCFFHPAYDTQENILRDAPENLRGWLRVPDARTFQKRVQHLQEDVAAWEWIIEEQRKFYEHKYTEHYGGIAEILRRIA